MKVERNVELPLKISKSLRINQKIVKPTTKALIDFINGTDENIKMTFDSEGELRKEFTSLRGYCNEHKFSVKFVIESATNSLYIVRKAVQCIPREDGALTGIITRHGNDDYGLWEGFALTKEEEMDIWAILMCHYTEGCSVRGTRKQIAEEMEG